MTFTCLFNRASAVDAGEAAALAMRAGADVTERFNTQSGETTVEFWFGDRNFIRWHLAGHASGLGLTLLLEREGGVFVEIPLLGIDEFYPYSLS